MRVAAERPAIYEDVSVESLVLRPFQECAVEDLGAGLRNGMCGRRDIDSGTPPLPEDRVERYIVSIRVKEEAPGAKLQPCHYRVDVL